MGVVERRARHKEALRRQILDAAREVFVREGYENVSMRKIAERIEYSPTTIYLYFKDKADLLNCLREEVFDALGDIVEKIVRESGDPVSRLRKGLRAYVDYGLAHPNDYKVAFLIEGPFLNAPGGISDETSAAFRLYDFLRQTVDECPFAGIEAETATQSLWAAVHGITSLLIIHRDFPWVERRRLIDSIIESMTAGLVRA